MDHQYVDMYLRKKKGYVGASGSGIPTSMDDVAHTASSRVMPSAADASGVERQVDRIVRGSFSVQQFVDRTDALSLQVETFEDKIVNLTKLVKLSQALHDEKESELRKQNHELKARLKRQEQITGKLASDFETLKSQMSSIIRDAVISATNPIVDDVQAFARASQDGLAEQDRKLQEAKDALTESILSQADSLFTRKMGHVQETVLHPLSQSLTRLQAQSEHQEKRLDAVENLRLPELRRTLEERIGSHVQLARESILAEAKSNLHVHLDTLSDEVDAIRSANENVKARVGNLERQSSSLDSAFTDFLSTFKDSTTLQSEKMESLSGTVKEFLQLHEQTRGLVETELESTKQWATRNLHRLKKHIDVINADLLALRESHVETSSQLQRVKSHAEAEHEKLLTLLQQKSREANVLSEIVDKEIQSIHQLTTQHRGHHHQYSQQQQQQHSAVSAPSSSAAGGGGATGVTAAAMNSVFASANGDPLETRRSGAGSGNLYDELAFTRRGTN